MFRKRYYIAWTERTPIENDGVVYYEIRQSPQYKTLDEARAAFDGMQPLSDNMLRAELVEQPRLGKHKTLARAENLKLITDMA